MTIGDYLRIIRQIEADCAFLDAETDNDSPIEKTEKVMGYLVNILDNLEEYRKLIEGVRIKSLVMEDK